nr:transposase [Saccharopolyspora sp. ASAGF58]
MIPAPAPQRGCVRARDLAVVGGGRAGRGGRAEGGADRDAAVRADRRQNALAAALKEYGALRRTIYAARYLSDPAYRRKISRWLNKGESLHALN